MLHYFALPAGYQQLHAEGLLPTVLQLCGLTEAAFADRLLTRVCWPSRSVVCERIGPLTRRLRWRTAHDTRPQTLAAVAKDGARTPLMADLLGRLLGLALLEPATETRLLRLLADAPSAPSTAAAGTAAAPGHTLSGAALFGVLAEPICMYFAAHFERFAAELAAQPNRTVLIDVLGGIVEFLIGHRKYLQERCVLTASAP